MLRKSILPRRTTVLAVFPLALASLGCAGPPGDGNRPPVGTIVAPPSDVSMAPGDSVYFQGTSLDPDDSVVAWSWNFGDGRQSTALTPGYVQYEVAGTYQVSFHVVDSDGATSVPDGRTLTVSSAPPPPAGNYALRFYGLGRGDADRVKIRLDDPATSLPGPPADIGATDITIELWIRGTRADNPAGAINCGNNVNWINGNIFFDRDRFTEGGRKFGMSVGNGRIAVGITGASDDQTVTICGTTDILDDQWHHVALTRRVATGALELFIDGVSDAQGTGPAGDISYPDAAIPSNNCNGPCTFSDPFLVLGAEKHDADPVAYPSFNGFMDELRLSTVVRYAGPFTRPSARFSTDGSTAALYHFDEGQGTILRDASGATGGPSNGQLRLGGSPLGPAWVTSTAPTGH